jgi:DNA-binding response OmpR family regulator
MRPAAGHADALGMRVLIIDDEPDVLLLCRVNLELGGHEVLQAPNGQLGLELAVTEAPDVIVLDVMLPVRDGLSVMSQLAADPRTAQIPVILLTAKTQLEDRLAGWRAGCTDYVAKPFSPADLLRAVDLVSDLSSEERRSRRDRELARLAAHV